MAKAKQVSPEGGSMTTTVNPKGEYTLTSVSKSSLVSQSDLAGQTSVTGPSVELTTESRCATALLESVAGQILLFFVAAEAPIIPISEYAIVKIA